MERLGGEYQRTDVDVKSSTIEGRTKFLELTALMAPKVYRDLLGPCKLESLPTNAKEYRAIEYRWIRFFLLHAKDPSWYLIDTESFCCGPAVRDTPFLAYFDYIHKNKSLLAELTEESRAFWKPSAEKSYAYDSLVADRTITALIPSWEELQSKSDSEWLCKELSKWAEDWNLQANWCLNFALDCLGILKNEYIDLLHPGEEYLNSNDEFWEYRRNWIDGKAWYEARLEKLTLKKTFTDFEYNNSLPDKLLEQLTFDYSWSRSLRPDDKEAIEIHTVLFPFGNKPFADFIRAIEQEFWGKFFAYFSNNWTFCTDKTESISRAIHDFDKKLKAFVTKARKTIEQAGNVEKTVAISSDKYFRWFVDYQVNKREIRDIATREDMNYKTISEGIEGIARLIDLPVRTRRGSGRPPGVKNSGIGSAGRTK